MGQAESGGHRVRLATRDDLPGLGRIIRWSIEEGWSNFETAAFDPGAFERTWEECSPRYPWFVTEIGGRIPIVGGASAPKANEVIAAGRQAGANGIPILMVMACTSLSTGVRMVL